MPTMDTASNDARTHLPSSRCPAPGTSQPASSPTAGDPPLRAAPPLTIALPTTVCALVVIHTHHTSRSAFYSLLPVSKSAPAHSAFAPSPPPSPATSPCSPHSARQTLRGNKCPAPPRSKSSAGSIAHHASPDCPD